MAFMKDILTHNIPIWEECAATPFVQEVQTGKLPLEKFKRYMIQDSIYLKNYARIYGKAIFHADTLREIQLYYSMLNFVNDTESEVRLDYLKQFCMTDNDIELIAPLPENQNYIDFMFEICVNYNQHNRSAAQKNPVNKICLLLVFSVPTERAAIATGNDLRGLGICHQQALAGIPETGFLLNTQSYVRLHCLPICEGTHYVGIPYLLLLILYMDCSKL